MDNPRLINIKDVTEKDKSQQEEFISDILDSVFISPTDTVYGIACNAEDLENVKKIREIKGKDEKPFSIIAPSFEYILKNFETSEEELKKYLPGPYVLILKKKDPESFKGISGNNFVGIRIPDNDFTRLLQKTGKPIVITSANKSGENPVTNIFDIKPGIKNQVSFIIDSGILNHSPAKVIKHEELPDDN